FASGGASWRAFALLSAVEWGGPGCTISPLVIAPRLRAPRPAAGKGSQKPEGPKTLLVTGFRRLVLAALLATYLLVIVGAAVRAFGAGLACPDWPLCHAAPVPPAGDTLATIEWSHRVVAGITGLLILAVAGWALLRSALPRIVRFGAFLALVLVVFQALLGAGAVLSELAQEIVTAHLATALTLLGLLVFVWIRVGVGGQQAAPPGGQRFTLLAAFTT